MVSVQEEMRKRSEHQSCMISRRRVVGWGMNSLRLVKFFFFFMHSLLFSFFSIAFNTFSLPLFTGRSLQNLTARISESGWAWLVSGRRLFVWRYADQQDSSGGGGSSGFGASIISGGGWPAISGSNTPSSSFSSKSKAGSVTTKCYELLLPPSDIAHRAELICVISSIGGVGSGGGSGYHRGVSKFPAALAVSPEGAIRYWANISQESNVHDSIVSASTADLHGQECLTLVDIAPVGAILGTTTGSLVHIAFTGGSVLSESSSGGGRGVLTVSSGGAPFTCRTLKAPTGLLSGIGRRVSSFIFGSLPVTAAGVDASKQLVRIVRSSVPSADGSGDDGGDAVLLPLYFLVLTNSSLQKWIVEDNATEGVSSSNRRGGFVAYHVASLIFLNHYHNFSLLSLSLF